MTDEEAPGDGSSPTSAGPGGSADEEPGSDPGSDERATTGSAAETSDGPPTGDSVGGEHGFGDEAVRGDGDDGGGRAGDSELADAGLVTRFRRSESPVVVMLRETLSSALIVAAVGIVLFAVSGIWPPMVAVESGSMEPHMQKGDLVFVTEPGRFAPDAARGDTGIVTYEVGSEVDYATFGQSGSVIVYRQPGRFGPPIIHRARFYVEAGENWYDRANPDYLPGDSCEEVPNCPAPNAGFVTKGDNNGMYDQVNTIGAPPVRPSWVRGVARVRIPLLGWIRLIFSGAATAGPPPVADLGVASAGLADAGLADAGLVSPGFADSGVGTAAAATGDAGVKTGATAVTERHGVCRVTADATAGRLVRSGVGQPTVSSGA